MSDDNEDARRLERMEKALKEFVSAIDATGGVTEDEDGLTVPVGDMEWSDLGDAYLSACHALGATPKKVSDSI
jgi:hypothetical protein